MEVETYKVPEITTNSLADIISWLGFGDIVVLHCNNFRRMAFHNNNEIQGNERIIYVNVSSMPSLLDVGEWNWYIEKAGNLQIELPILSPDRKNVFYCSV